MDLKQFLSSSGISVRAFARMCGTSASSVIRARDGHVIPSRRFMQRIFTATGGLVGPADLVPKGFTQPDTNDEEGCT
jgi:hypothetical protein